MTCPHCKYTHGWSPERTRVERGDAGEFYKHPILMKKPGGIEHTLLGCPKCYKTFIGDMYCD
jgi:hypothetical protein